MSHNPNDTFDKRRFGLITGSGCSVLFPEKGNGLVGQTTFAKELANQLYWKYYDNVSTWQTTHGDFNEAAAYDYYMERYDKTAIYQPPFECIDYFGGQGDVLGDVAGADMKCPTSLNKWLDYLHKGIDKDQYNQAQMYMYLYKKDVWNVCAFLAETDKMNNEGDRYPVPEHQRMIIVPVQKDVEWVSKLRAASIPVIELRDMFYQRLVTQFGER